MLDTLKRLCKRRSLKFILDKADPDSDEEWRIKLKVKEEEATKPAPLPPLIVGSTFSRRCTIRKAVHAHSIASVKSDYLNDGTYKLWCDRDGCKYAVHAKQDYGAIIWCVRFIVNSNGAEKFTQDSHARSLGSSGQVCIESMDRCCCALFRQRSR